MCGSAGRSVMMDPLLEGLPSDAESDLADYGEFPVDSRGIEEDSFGITGRTKAEEEQVLRAKTFCVHQPSESFCLSFDDAVSMFG